MTLKDLVISFSGGETSAYMAYWLLKNKSKNYNRIFCVFANTGQENEETLKFVNQCDKEFNLNVYWIESKVFQNQRKGSGHSCVSYKTASRNGEPFEQVIKKYGIPNKAYPHCTRELKLNPINSWLKAMNIHYFDMAIGIRADEIDRMQIDAKQKNIIYPLVKIGVTKPKVNQFWALMPFRLKLKGYQGNCSWCWKKSLRKHLTLIKESPEIYDFPKKMEMKYGLNGHNIDGTSRVFFRDNMSVKDLMEMAKMPFNPAQDDSEVYPHPDMLDELDQAGGCSESCEVEF